MKLYREVKDQNEAMLYADGPGNDEALSIMLVPFEITKDGAGGMPKRCKWYIAEDEGGDEYYDTECGEAYVLVDGTLEENKHNYCPFCGGKIDAKGT